MRRGDLLDDWQEHRQRRVVTAAIVLLVVGLLVGAVFGIALARAFDAAPLEELRQEFSGPDSSAALAPR
jgi:hypothetical protein